MADKKFGISDLAKALGIQEPTARKNLRDAGIKKSGASYEWGKSEFDSVVKKLNASPSKGAVPAGKAKKATKKKAA